MSFTAPLRWFLATAGLLLLAPVSHAQPRSPSEQSQTELPSPATPTQPSDAGNEANWLGTLYEQSRGAVVRIETEFGVGAGFFYHSPAHVATAYHVIENARSIEVTIQGGNSSPAEVVAWDAHYDLAILKVAGATKRTRTLEAYSHPVEVGMKVAVLGHPYADLSRLMPQLRGLLNWSLTQGIVGAVSESWIQTDAAVNPGNSGGPLLAPNGQVLGVISARIHQAEGIGLVTRVARLEQLTKRIGMAPPAVNPVSPDSIELGWATHHLGAAELSGFMFGAGVRFWDRLPLRLRFSFVDGDFVPGETAVTEREVRRIASELELGYLLFDSIFQLSLHVGGGLYYDRSYDTRLSVIDAGPEIQKRVTRDTDWSFLPMVGLTPQLGGLRFNYAYRLAFLTSESSQHRWYVALAF